MKRILIGLLFYIALCFMFSCSAGWHIKRAIKKDPTILVKDTLIVRDTIKHVTDRVEVDSVFMVSKDTVTIVKDNLTVKHFINRDSVFIFAQCSEDTIYIPYEKAVPYEKIVYKEEKRLIPIWFWIAGAITLTLWLLNKKRPLI